MLIKAHYHLHLVLNYSILLCIISFSLCQTVCSQSISYGLEEYTKADGLLDNSIADITVSSRNEVFAVNRQQLLKYEQGEFIEIKNLRGLPRTSRIFVDTNNILWVIFDHHNAQNLEDKFVLFDIDDQYKEVIKGDYIQNINEFKTKALFRILTDINEEVFFLTKENETFKIDIRAEEVLFANHLNSIEVIQNCFIKPNFILSPDPYNIYVNNYKEELDDNPEAKQLDLYGYNGWECNVRNNSTETLFFNESEIVALNRNTSEFTVLSKHFPEYLYQRKIHCLACQENTYWIGTNKGILKITKSKSPFTPLLEGKNLSIREMAQIDSTTVIVATDKGLYNLNPKNKKYSEIDPRYFYGIESISEEQFALFNWFNQISFLDKANPDAIQSEVKFDRVPNPGRFIMNGSMLDDSNMILCDNTTTYLYNLNDKSLQKIKSNSHIVDLHMNCDTLFSKIFCYTVGGIIEVDTATLTSVESEYFKPINDYIVSSLTPDYDSDCLWICTKGHGLIKWNLSDQSNQSYSLEDGLHSNNVHSAILGENGRLWLSTDTGISILDKNTDEIVTLTSQFGIHENEMNSHSFLKLENGEILYGTINGIIKFDPVSLKIDLEDFKLSKSFLRYYSNKFSTKEEIKFDTIPSQIDIYSHYENISLNLFTEETAVNNTIRYRFQQSENSKWTRKSNGIIPISNIEEDDILFVSYKLNLSEWSTPTKIRIELHQPYYKSIWFWLTCFGLLALTAIILLYLSKERGKKTNRKIQEKVDSQTEELTDKILELSKVNAINQKLLSVIGHDLRSPVLSLHELNKNYNYLIKSNQNDNLHKFGDAIEANSKNVINVIDRLLDWSTSNKEKEINVETINIKSFIDEVIPEFKEEVAKKNISLINLCERDLDKNIDKEGLRIIVRNILHNSIKFSHKDSTIEVRSGQKDNKEAILLIDEGKGLSTNRVNTINSRKPIDSTEGTHGEKGIGIGLQICRTIGDKIGVQISVKNNQGLGVTSYITFTDDL